MERCLDINKSKKRKHHNFQVDDQVLVKNNMRWRKFDPIYSDHPWTITHANETGVTVRNEFNNKTKTRHVDDIKPYYSSKLSHPPETRSEHTGTYSIPFELQPVITADDEQTENTMAEGPIHTPLPEQNHIEHQEPLQRPHQNKQSMFETLYKDYSCR